jgi:hypothetical protein
MRPTGAAGSTPSLIAALLSDGGRWPKPSGPPVAKHNTFGTSATASGPAGRVAGCDGPIRADAIFALPDGAEVHAEGLA